jgi:hypothetical protein
MLIWDVSLGWVHRRETRYISQERRQEFEKHQARREVTANSGTPQVSGGSQEAEGIMAGQEQMGKMADRLIAHQAISWPNQSTRIVSEYQSTKDCGPAGSSTDSDLPKSEIANLKTTILVKNESPAITSMEADREKRTEQNVPKRLIRDNTVSWPYSIDSEPNVVGRLGTGAAAATKRNSAEIGRPEGHGQTQNDTHVFGSHHPKRSALN